MMSHHGTDERSGIKCLNEKTQPVCDYGKVEGRAEKRFHGANVVVE
jgi:hypothetical protein